VLIGDVCFDLIVKQPLSSFKFDVNTGGTSYSSSITMLPGGTGNIAVGLSRLGGKTQFIGKAGNDQLGILYRDDLIAEYVKTNLLFDETHPTGLIVVTVNRNGERSFLVSRGANDFLDPTEIEYYTNDIIKSRFLYVCGYSLVKKTQRDAILKAVKIAKSNNVKVIFDLGSYNLINQYRSVFNKLVDQCDIIIPNLEEAQALTNCIKINDVAKYLSKKVPLSALKMGKAGCLLITPKKTFKFRSNKVRCIDSTGAGDAFASGIIYGLVNKLNLETIGTLANWYASFNVQKLGPRAFPTEIAIQDYLERII
jgi:sugar/nucleoside kinase (ribokinase family)